MEGKRPLVTNEDDPLAAELRQVFEERRRARTDEDFRRERMRAISEGEKRHWDKSRPLVKTESRTLRGMWKDRVRLDVVCRRRLIARVLERETRDGLEIAMETVGAGSMTSVEGMPYGYASTIVSVGDGPIVVGCRCARRRHKLDDGRLITLAMGYRPGRPGEVGVSAVETTT